jgi:hypothetical protein
MEIITRQQAITLGLKKYFTGEPCKNGHIAERYLQSSTCEMCIRGSVAPQSDSARTFVRLEIQQERLAIERSKNEQRDRRLQLAEAHAKLQERKLALRPKPTRKDLVELRVDLHWGDVELFKSTMLFTAQMSDPTITMGELLTNKVISGGINWKRYVFKCSPVDFEDLHACAKGLENKRRASGTDEDTNAYRAWKLAQAEEDARTQAALDEEDNGRPERLDA